MATLLVMLAIGFEFQLGCQACQIEVWWSKTEVSKLKHAKPKDAKSGMHAKLT